MTQPPDLSALAEAFRKWGEAENVRLQSPLMAHLAQVVAHDGDLLALAAEAPPNQPKPNLLFSAVHDLILAGTRHPLAEHYASVGGTLGPAGSDAPFRDFCMENREAIRATLSTRMVQTQVVKRAVCLLPSFAHVFADGGTAPLTMIEVGCSAGLIMQWDRFHYDFGKGTTWGNPSSALSLTTEVRGRAFPALPAEIPVAWRRGVDLNPLDPTDPREMRWLRALTWPEDNARRDELGRAIAIARATPPTLVRGDAVEIVPALIADAPAGTTVCAYAPFSMYQFPPSVLEAFLRALREASRVRPIALLRMDEAGIDSAVDLTWFNAGTVSTRRLVECNAHGKWLTWVG
ncbi:MAG TPA: DUF2332 domain-containing protein [Tepidiformaceae bacterium]|nr:DUF2332 domain-containing protein [Tepidiformaceae bacterium]